MLSTGKGIQPGVAGAAKSMQVELREMWQPSPFVFGQPRISLPIPIYILCILDSA